MREFERMEFDARAIRARAMEFSRERFRGRFTAAIARLTGRRFEQGESPETECTDTRVS
jgi:hypothetical protein